MRWFRILLVAELLAGILSAVVSGLTEGMLPEPLRLWQQREAGYMTTTENMLLLMLSVPAVVLTLVSMVGLFFFWRPARILYVAATLFVLVIDGVSGPVVDSGYGYALDQLATILAGMVIALAWFSPLNGVFDRHRTRPPSH